MQYAVSRDSRRSQFTSVLASFEAKSISSANESQTCDRSVIKWHPCESTKPPPLTRPPQGDSKQKDPLAHPSGSLHFYAGIRGFFTSSNFDGVETTGRARHPSPPQMARIGAKGSKPRDAPQTRPMLRNPAKHGTFMISNDREVLAKMPGAWDEKPDQRVPCDLFIDLIKKQGALSTLTRRPVLYWLSTEVCFRENREYGECNSRVE